jgi:hypothetical protein
MQLAGIPILDEFFAARVGSTKPFRSTPFTSMNPADAPPTASEVRGDVTPDLEYQCKPLPRGALCCGVRQGSAPRHPTRAKTARAGALARSDERAESVRP